MMHYLESKSLHEAFLAFEAWPPYTEALKKNGYNTNLQFDMYYKGNEKNKTRKWNIT